FISNPAEREAWEIPGGASVAGLGRVRGADGLAGGGRGVVVHVRHGRTPPPGRGSPHIHLPRRGDRAGGKRGLIRSRSGPDHGDRGGVGIGQEHRGPVHPPDPPPPRPDREWADPLLPGWRAPRRPGRPRPRRPPDARHPRGGDHDRFPGADDRLLARPYHREPDRRGRATPPRGEPGRGSARGHRGSPGGGLPRSRPEGRCLPLRAVGSSPPARDDRHGPRLPSRPPPRLRADLGPRRHRPGPDPRPPPGPPEGVRPHPPPDHPRSGRGRVRGRPRDRDVLRQGDGDGARRRVLRAPTASLSAGPPPEHAPLRPRPGGAPPDDPGHGPRPAPADLRLPVPLPLSGGRARAVRARHAGPPGARPRPPGGVLQARLEPRAGGRGPRRLTVGEGPEPLLEVRDLTKEFPLLQPWLVGLARRQVGTIVAVDGVSFTVHRRQTLGLVGESGCGKTTTARLVLRAIRPTRGEILFRTATGMVRVDQLEGRALRAIRPHIQLIFQDPFSSLDPRMPVGEIIAEPLKLHRYGTPAETVERVKALMAMV